MYRGGWSKESLRLLLLRTWQLFQRRQKLNQKLNNLDVSQLLPNFKPCFSGCARGPELSNIEYVDFASLFMRIIETIFQVDEQPLISK